VVNLQHDLFHQLIIPRTIVKGPLNLLYCFVSAIQFTSGTINFIPSAQKVHADASYPKCSDCTSVYIKVSLKLFLYPWRECWGCGVTSS